MRKQHRLLLLLHCLLLRRQPRRRSAALLLLGRSCHAHLHLRQQRSAELGVLHAC